MDGPVVDRPFESVVEGNRISLYRDGAQWFPSLLQAIAEAEREIFIEMYWFASDRTGRTFAEALGDAARRGLDVRIVYDSLGSLGASLEMFDDLRATGCKVHEFHPVAPWAKRFRFARIGRRNHRKAVIIDDRTCFTGGANFGDEWAGTRDGGLGWRDDMIGVEGPATHQMRVAFLRTWRRCGYQVDASEVQDGAVAGPVRVLASDLRNERKTIRREYLTRIRGAREYLYLTNSYFLPDGLIRWALARAARRGVDVRVLLPGESDVPAVQYASRHLFSWFGRHGVKIYEWLPSILHAKSAVVDDSWATVGTCNLDYLSFRGNFEINVVVEDRRVAQAMKAQFLDDIARSRFVDQRTRTFRSLGDRALEWFFFLFRRFL